MKRLAATTIGNLCLADRDFRSSISLYQGMFINFIYALFCVVEGARFVSIWLISIAAYYLVLGILRAYLIFGYQHRHSGLPYEYRCYRRTAWLLFLLNIPMGGMILLMVQTNSGFSYPGYVIYLAAIYTFCMMIISIINLVKFRKMDSPILSAAKTLNFVAAMMSVLGLQTAMISRFSASGENYRKLMNAVTGGCIYGIVIILAACMLIRAAITRKRLAQ